MTAKHLIEGAMKHMGARTPTDFARKVGIFQKTVCRLLSGEGKGMNIATLDQIQRVSGVPIETLMQWYRLLKESKVQRAS